MDKTIPNTTHSNEEIDGSISVIKACQIAIQAKNNNEASRANRIISVISKTIKEDGKKGCYSRFVNIDELDRQ